MRGGVEERLIAVGQRRAHPLALDRPAPIRGGGDAAGVGGEADVDRVVAVALAHELADVQFAAVGHLGGARVAHVRVVRPHDHPGGAAVAVQVRDELVERVRHVPVALVPGAGAVAEHRAVVLLGVRHDAAFCSAKKYSSSAASPVAREVLARAAAQLDELLDHSPSARLADAEQHRLAVAGAVARVRLQALVARPCARGRLRVLLVEVVDHGLHRGAKAVEVEAVEADLARAVMAPSLWVRSQPTKSSTSALRHIQVGKREKPPSAASASGSWPGARHVAVDAVGVGPVALDRDRGEAALGDQALGDAGALTVELVRSVAGLPEQDDPRVADQRKQRVVVAADRR